jgi:hypothetical protein
MPNKSKFGDQIPQKNIDSVASQFEKIQIDQLPKFCHQKEKKRKDIFVIIYLSTWQVHVLLPCVLF